MTEEEKLEIERSVFQKLQIRAVLVGLPLILSLFFTFSQIVKGEQGEPGYSPSVDDIVTRLKDDNSFIVSVTPKHSSIAQSLSSNVDFINRMRLKIGSESHCENTCKRVLGSEKDRFCFLTNVQGAFNGNPEFVSVRIEGGSWVLSTRSGGSPVWAKARCLIYSQ
tara:strand:+ start:513 stop:1007 length:495 start_codon:yes stop_codon:yes gene_type:complete